MAPGGVYHSPSEINQTPGSLLLFLLTSLCTYANPCAACCESRMRAGTLQANRNHMTHAVFLCKLAALPRCQDAISQNATRESCIKNRAYLQKRPRSLHGQNFLTDKFDQINWFLCLSVSGDHDCVCHFTKWCSILIMGSVCRTWIGWILTFHVNCVTI